MPAPMKPPRYRKMKTSRQVLISLEREDETVEALRRLSLSMRNLEPAWERVFTMMDNAERRLFSRVNGRYVRTGRTRSSLTTNDHRNAIRVAHSDEAIFGTNVWYAAFLRKGRKSAVLQFEAPEKKKMAKILLDHLDQAASL